jgi:hypothetical protein
MLEEIDYPLNKVKTDLKMAQESLLEDLAKGDIKRITELVTSIKAQIGTGKLKISDELIGGICQALAQEHEYTEDYLLNILGQVYQDIDTVFG